MVDGSKRYKLATVEGDLLRKDWKVQGFSDFSTKRWDIVKAVSNGADGCFKLFLVRQGKKQGEFELLEANASGLINGSSKWQATEKALKEGLEGVFGDEIQRRMASSGATRDVMRTAMDSLTVARARL